MVGTSALRFIAAVVNGNARLLNSTARQNSIRATLGIQRRSATPTLHFAVGVMLNILLPARSLLIRIMH
jgi:hypothetical protein